MWKEVRAVLFDLDGTLIDSAPDLGAAADRMRTDRGMPSIPYERYRPMAGAGARGMLGVGFGLTPDSPEFAQMREEFFRNYEQCMTERTYAFEGVEELIARLQAVSMPWGVVTNKAARFTLPLMRELGLHERASSIISGDSGNSGLKSMSTRLTDRSASFTSATVSNCPRTQGMNSNGVTSVSPDPAAG